MNLSQTRFKVQGSLTLKALFCVLFFGAFLSVFLVSITWWAKILLTICILRYLKEVVKKYNLLRKSNIQLEFWFGGEKWWNLRIKSSEPILCSIKYPVFVSEYLIIINFIVRDKMQMVSLPIFRDSLDPEDFRKLKMILKGC